MVREENVLGAQGELPCKSWTTKKSLRLGTKAHSILTGQEVEIVQATLPGSAK
jgi:hypothetical protein